MTNSIEELELPKAVINRLIKSALPESTIVQKDAKTALSRAAVVFVNYLSMHAQAATKKAAQKTITMEHVCTGLVNAGLSDIASSVRERVTAMKMAQREKRLAKMQEKTAETLQEPLLEEEEGAELDENTMETDLPPTELPTKRKNDQELDSESKQLKIVQEEL